MKIGLTGHTSGIGKALHDRLLPDVLGFSRSNGYDITNATSRARIINACEDCDAFINNAEANYGQTDLLIDLFRRWKDTDKVIVNVGSRITEIKLPGDQLHLLSYSAQKHALKATVETMQGFACGVSYVWFGYVGTDRIRQKYPHFTEADYISIDTAVDLVLEPLLRRHI